MSDQDTTEVVENDETAEDQSTDAENTDSQEEQDDSSDWRSNFDADKAAERIRKIQSENKNLRARAKAAEDKAAEAGDKDKRITTLEADLMRERVGRRLNLPDELVDRLRGGTEDELLADAEKLVGLVGGKSLSRRPTERLRGGGEPDAEPEPDIAKIVADIPRR